MHVRKTALVMLSLLVLLAACEKKPVEIKSAAPAGPPWAGQMSLSTTPTPPVTGKDTIFQITLADQTGKPVSGATLKASLIMREMDMGKNEVNLTDKGNGAYEGTGKFTMAGPWNVVVNAAQAGKTGQQTFPIIVNRE